MILEKKSNGHPKEQVGRGNIQLCQSEPVTLPTRKGQRQPTPPLLKTSHAQAGTTTSVQPEVPSQSDDLARTLCQRSKVHVIYNPITHTTVQSRYYPPSVGCNPPWGFTMGRREEIGGGKEIGGIFLARWEAGSVGGQWQNKTLLNEFWHIFGSFLPWLHVLFCFLFASLLLLTFPMPFWTCFVCCYILILLWIFLFWNEARWHGLTVVSSVPASVTVFYILTIFLLSLMFLFLQVMQILVLWSGTVLHYLLNSPKSPTIGNWEDKSHGQRQMLSYLLQVYRTKRFVPFWSPVKRCSRLLQIWELLVIRKHQWAVTPRPMVPYPNLHCRAFQYWNPPNNTSSE